MELRAWIMGRKKKKRHGVWHLSIAHRTRFDAAREGELRRGAMALCRFGPMAEEETIMVIYAISLPNFRNDPES
jgi:hypothetical protein